MVIAVLKVTCIQSRNKRHTPTWPPELRLVCLKIDYRPTSPEPVEAVAECMPTVRIIKIVTGSSHIAGFWSVCRLVNEGGISRHSQDPKLRVLCKKWGAYEELVLKEETLDQHGCQDTWFETFK